MSAATDYLEQLKLRTTHPSATPPKPVDWADAPRLFAIRSGCREFPLLSGGHLLSKLAEHSRPGSMTYEALSECAWLTLGVLRQKLDIDWARGAEDVLPSSRTAYGRGTPSGGGLYPNELYVVIRGHEVVPDGIYHYCESRSSLWALRLGDHTSHLATALRSPNQSETYFIFVSRFWKNDYKYHDLSYQLATEDVGAMLGTLLAVASNRQIDARVVYNFDDVSVNSLLGLEPGVEATLAVVELGPSRSISSSTPPNLPSTVAIPPYLERSKHVALTPGLRELHESTYAVATKRPLQRTPEQFSSSDVIEFQSEAPPLPSADFDLFVRRRSSMGLQVSGEPITHHELGGLFQELFLPYQSDLTPNASPPTMARVGAYLTDVEKSTQAAYTYDHRSHRLSSVGAHLPRTSLHRLYFLDNYNLFHTSVLVAIIGDTDQAFSIWGDRGLRIINAEAGLLAQRAYVACSKLNLACGAALGFDPRVVDALFGLDRRFESTLLCLFISRPPDHRASFNASYG